MKPGNGKLKGNAFENQIAKTLSRWLTKNQREDVLERSPSSGAKATIHRKQKKRFDAIEGDIISVSPQGNILIQNYVIELKHQSPEMLNIINLIYQTAKTGIWEYWETLNNICIKVKKQPMLIFRQNSRPILIALNQTSIEHFNLKSSVIVVINHPSALMCVLPFTTFLTKADPSHLTSMTQPRPRIRLPLPKQV